MKAVGVIPARWGSTRLPGKVLVDICGKPMIQHVWERARRARRLSDVIIACDDEHVLAVVRKFGANAVMTRKDHASGSDRVAEAVKTLNADMVVNIQGDEPLIQEKLIDDLVETLQKDAYAVVATAIKRIASAEEFANPNVVKAVIDAKGYALYFSRASIPFKRDGVPSDFTKYFKHLGIYAYRRQFLFDYCQWPKSFLEEEEKLEQLRVLEAGYKIRCVETDAETIGVDTPEDVQRAVNYLKVNSNL